MKVKVKVLGYIFLGLGLVIGGALFFEARTEKISGLVGFESSDRGPASVNRTQQMSYVLVVQIGTKETRFELLYEGGKPVLKRMERPGFGRKLTLTPEKFDEIKSSFQKIGTRKFNYPKCPESWISAVTFNGSVVSNAAGFCLKEKDEKKSSLVQMANSLSRMTRQ